MTPIDIRPFVRYSIPAWGDQASFMSLQKLFEMHFDQSREDFLKRQVAWAFRHFEIFSMLSNNDEIVKSHKARHSRESGSPQQIDFTGFPLSRE